MEAEYAGCGSPAVDKQPVTVRTSVHSRIDEWEKQETARVQQEAARCRAAADEGLNEAADVVGTAMRAERTYEQLVAWVVSNGELLLRAIDPQTTADEEVVPGHLVVKLANLIDLAKRAPAWTESHTRALAHEIVRVRRENVDYEHSGRRQMKRIAHLQLRLEQFERAAAQVWSGARNLMHGSERLEQLVQQGQGPQQNQTRG